ncbi:septal ring lytic transglycosylase RlpA family protein [Flavobacterium sp. F-380]|uniref:Probable endolytic peptidoglycan transglycosylase RlpA n=1 Tax=Flavobacterium kayseriense TaxID=2764714 RepID=A0ABR7J462_9FLAO|nr:septal ring lytic transglycosylase RlpA family protein [Flavobacterium kayseriense]MBC5840330.1 septal ring lytic transglycosylase RlpA family protein [Flavobacterium kayseriense]MBC5847000.1 septal ring lytic transglycosylase RlpA family protein [Flavobacterium kayseriense]
MKKSITLLFFFFAFAFVSIHSKGFVDKSITEIQKDTVKKNKQGIVIQEATKDSLWDGRGKLKFYKSKAHASYYADKFHGKRTASGVVFDKNKYTAAHKKLPFGTKVKVTNEANGKFVVVEITDRGPFVKSREIDLSKKAFMDIVNNKGAGSMLVTLEVIVE